MDLTVAAFIQDLTKKLEGASALNVYLLHKLGGQAIVHRDELNRIVREFHHMKCATEGPLMKITLHSCPHEQEAA